MFKVYVNDGSEPLPEDDICYIVAKEGIFLKKRAGVMESIAPVQNISILESVASTARMHINPIPAQSFAKVIHFFREVYNKYRAEAIVLLYYNEETGKYKIVPPEQKVTGASLNYDRNLTIDGWTMIGDIHSHAGMSAFHSGTDDSDEESFDGLHITLGNMNSDDISISGSIVANGHRFMIDPEDYVLGIKKTHDVDKTEKGFARKVYKWVNNKMVLDEKQSKSYTYRRMDKRYVSTVSPSKAISNPDWMKRVEEGTFQRIGWGGDWRQGNYWNGWNQHYDPHAWRSFHKVGSKAPLHAQPPVHGVQTVLPTINTGGELDDQVPPCMTCKHREIKLLMEEIDLEPELYECMQCNIVVGGDDPICPKCGSDEYLVLLEEDDYNLQDNYTTDEEIESKQSIENPDQIHRKCEFCGREITLLPTDIACPECHVLFPEDSETKYSTAEDMEMQARIDSASFLSSEAEEANKAALIEATNIQRLKDPQHDQIPINKEVKQEGILDKLGRFLSRKAGNA
jgi:PRTRC genetic system protein A